jgi:hypothetical protein
VAVPADGTTLVQLWEGFNSLTVAREFVFFYVKGDVPVLPSSTNINANGYYPGTIWNRLTNIAGAACWLIAVGPATQPGHAIFLKPYIGTPIGTHTDKKPIYAIWANEDLCRPQFDGDISTVQHYNASKRQQLTHDTVGPWIDWSDPTTVDDQQNIAANQQFNTPRASAPIIPRILSSGANVGGSRAFAAANG